MFATAEDLRRFLRRTTIDTDAANLVLNLAGQAIRAELGQQLDHVTGDTYVCGPGEGRVLLLPELPVTAVTSVAEYGQQLVEGDDYEWSHAGTLTRLGGAWPAAARSVVVTYDHGHPEPPPVLRAVCVQVAARVFVNPQATTSLSIGDYARSWSSTTGAGRTGHLELTDYERRLLRGLRP